MVLVDHLFYHFARSPGFRLLSAGGCFVRPVGDGSYDILAVIEFKHLFNLADCLEWTRPSACAVKIAEIPEQDIAMALELQKTERILLKLSTKRLLSLAVLSAIPVSST
jgi:hypothetical protein